MKPRLLVVGSSPSQFADLREVLSQRFELSAEHGLLTAAAVAQHGAVRAVLVCLHETTLNGTAPDEYFFSLQAATTALPIVALADETCPDDLRRLAQTHTDLCLVAPIEPEPLLQYLLTDRDPATNLAGLCSGLPNRVLHGRSRSLITFAPTMFEMMNELKVAAAHDVTILLIGETGVGKTFLARLIHELSPQYNERCLTVACGALPPDLIESEMFGYVKGAFTGADRDKPGKFSAAGAGTLLLDEIDVLPLEQQAKLLRVIETGEYEPVGSNDTEHCNARLVVASNYDLEALVEAGSFRRDLYYRLNVLKFFVPPLRERPADIEYLARNFALAHGRQHNIPLREIDQRFIDVLRHYSWPGNIRELENVIRRAVLYCRRGVLTVEELPSSLREAVQRGGETSLPVSNSNTLEERVGVVERRIIEDSLRRNDNHRQDTAKELGISRVTLYNKMKKFGMMTPTATF